MYSWVCNEDGSDCGIDDDDSGVECMGQARTRDTSEGTRLRDGDRGYIARIPTSGELVADVPMDENANYISGIFEVRVWCQAPD
ncbi:MAG TPA: hypothetical protein VJR89_19410 [Polyangiales bacterium]|nr:hypothetical protein [Polyangiales bacterium]